MLFRVWKLFVTTFQIWDRSNSSRMSAAMTYYTMLSLAPLLMIAIAIAGYVYDDSLVESEIIENVKTFSSPEIAATIASVIKNATHPSSGLIASTISLLVLFYGASGIFTQLFDTFNDIWQVPLEGRTGLKFTIRKRLVGVLMVLVAGVLLIGTLGLESVLAYLNGLVAGKYPQYPQLTTWLNLVDRGLSFILLPFVLSLIFWFFPAKRMRWTDVWPAAGLTAAMLAASRYLINIYLQFSTASEVYGAAGSLVVLLIWVYITGMVVFFGASFSCAWAGTFGSQSDLGASAKTENGLTETEPDEPTEWDAENEWNRANENNHEHEHTDDRLKTFATEDSQDEVIFSIAATSATGNSNRELDQAWGSQTANRQSKSTEMLEPAAESRTRHWSADIAAEILPLKQRAESKEPPLVLQRRLKP